MKALRPGPHRYRTARDNRRARLYRAEDAALWRFLDRQQKFHTTTEVQSFLTSLWLMPWFTWDAVRPTVKVSSSSKDYWADQQYWVISLPNQSVWYEWYILHECARFLTPNGLAWHGVEFACTLLTLITYQLGPNVARAFRSALAEKRFYPLEREVKMTRKALVS